MEGALLGLEELQDLELMPVTEMRKIFSFFFREKRVV